LISRQVYKPDREFQLVGGMIMNNDCLAAAYHRYSSGELKRKHFTRYFQPVFTWLIQYYSRHEGAPGTTIQKIFETRGGSLPSETRELVEEYLDNLAEDYRESETEPDYIRNEILPDFIRERAITLKVDNIQALLDREEYGKAEELLLEYESVAEEEQDEQLGTLLPFTEEDVEIGMDDKVKEQIAYRFKGDLDRLVGPLCKTWLVAVTGIEKSGKSYVMNEIGYDAALNQGQKVLVINIELSEQLARQRNYRRISLTGSKQAVGKNGRYLVSPVIDCENNQYHTCQVLKKMLNKTPLFRSPDEEVDFGDRKKWRTCTKCRDDPSIRKNARKTKRFLPAIWFERSKKKIRKTTEQRVMKGLKNNRMRRLKNFRMRCFPRFSVTFDEVEQYIKRYSEKHDWHPDIVIFDYLDILAPERGAREYRHDIDAKWKKAAGLASRLNCLVITADQATKAGRTQYQLDQMSTSESKTKDSHLDIRIAINQTDEEKRLEITRASVLFHRHEPFSVRREVLITQRLATSQPLLDYVFVNSGPKKKYRVTKE
jgi:replicative DNA helicase